MSRRACPTCRHAYILVVDRCAVPLAGNTICGCACPPRPIREWRTTQTGPVLEALKAGATWGYRIIDVTGIPESAVYKALQQLAADGVIEAVDSPTAPADRVEYRLVQAR